MAERESDQCLLQRYIAERCEAAFSELVRRHASMVYAAALRQLHSQHDAEDATQAVFLLLAQRARTIGPGVVLAGWLYKTARFTSSAIRRARQRRQFHEQQSAELMKSTSTQRESPIDGEVVFDHALPRLRAVDRDAIILRYLEDKPLKEVALSLRISEDAARVRIRRALVKLRRHMGLTTPATALPASLLRHAMVAAPPHVVDASCLLGGSAPSSSVILIAKGALTMIMHNKLRIAAAYALGTLVLLGGVTAIVTAAQNAGSPASTQPADTAQTPQGALHALMLALLSGDAGGARSLVYIDGAPDADAADTGAFDRAAKVQQTFVAALRKTFGDAAAADAYSNPSQMKQPAATSEEINGGVSIIHYNTGPNAYALPMIRVGGQWKLDLSRRPGEERSQEIIQGTRRIRPQLIEQARKIAQAYDLVTRKINGGEYSTVSAAIKELRARIAPPAEPRGK